jgi:hypothetical protein
MTEEWFAQVKHSTGKAMNITRTDGEIVSVKLLGIDQHYREVVCELVSSSQPEKYSPSQGTRLAIPFADIQAVSDCCGRGPLSKRRPSTKWHASRRRIA